jgi:hypothetical protein
MTEGWSRSGGWESFEAWKRWFLREWGWVHPPQRPSVRLFGVYRVFSAPEGVQTEVEVTGVDPAAVAAAEREVCWRAGAYLLKLQRHLPDSDHYGQPAVVLQVSFEAGPNRWPTLGRGEVAAPPSAPRRSKGELIAVALEDLGG